LLTNFDKPWDWKMLKPGAYRVIVLGLENIDGTGATDWPSLLEHNIACAAIARLTVER